MLATQPIRGNDFRVDSNYISSALILPVKVEGVLLHFFKHDFGCFADCLDDCSGWDTVFQQALALLQKLTS